MMFTMAQILNYYEKQLFMAYTLIASGIIGLSSIFISYMFPTYDIFFTVLAIFPIFLIIQSLLFSMVGKFVDATASINGVEMNGIDIDVDNMDKD